MNNEIIHDKIIVWQPGPRTVTTIVNVTSLDGDDEHRIIIGKNPDHQLEKRFVFYQYSVIIFTDTEIVDVDYEIVEDE